tara:strand:+ start:252 stop:596 length:345 start_codon:yes stop_codon:yes gene_type:complete
MNIPSENVKQMTLSRLNRHKKKFKRKGISDLRVRWKGNLLFVDVVKEEKSGMFGKFLGNNTVRGVGKVARLEFMGPNKWKLLIYKVAVKKYGPHPNFKGGTVEQCLDATADVFF